MGNLFFLVWHLSLAMLWKSRQAHGFGCSIPSSKIWHWPDQQPVTLLSLCSGQFRSVFKATYVVDSLNSPESPVVGAVYGLVYRIHLMVCVNFVWTGPKIFPNSEVMNMIGAVKHVGKALEAGVDLICAQGGEGGGHTGEICGMELLSGNLCVRFFSCLEMPGIYDWKLLHLSEWFIENGNWLCRKFVVQMLSKFLQSSIWNLQLYIYISYIYIIIYISFYIHWRFPGRHVTGKAHGPTIAQVTLPRPFCCPR